MSNWSQSVVFPIPPPILSRLSSIIVALSPLLTAAAQADGFEYKTIGDTITITGYTGVGGKVDIPETIDSLPVTVIGNEAFFGNGTVTDVTIPDSVVLIDSAAFGECSALTNVTIGACVSEIRHYPFYGCTNLIAISVGVTNQFFGGMDGVLFDKNGTTLVQYPGGRVGSYTVPESVTNIAFSAFGRSISLSSVRIPDGVAEVGSYAFYGCSGLTNVVIGSGVTRMSNDVFWDCTSLGFISVDSMNPAYASVNGVLLDKSRAFLMVYPAGKIGEYAVPDTVNNIRASSFFHCVSLTSVLIGEGVTNISAYAFLNCSRLMALNVDPLNPVYSSQDGVLFDKTKATILRFPEGWEGSYSVHNSVTAIGENAFFACRDLTSIYFLGNAPVLADELGFLETGIATIYYLPGTTGWINDFGGRPTAIWQPEMLTDDVSFGVENGEFGFQISWAKDLVVEVEASEDLNDPDGWETLETIPLIDGVGNFSDPDWASHPGRFYRLRMAP